MKNLKRKLRLQGGHVDGRCGCGRLHMVPDDTMMEVHDDLVMEICRRIAVEQRAACCLAVKHVAESTANRNFEEARVLSAVVRATA